MVMVMVMVMCYVMVRISVFTGPHPVTSWVTPAPCVSCAAVPRTVVRKNLLSPGPLSPASRDYGMVLYRGLPHEAGAGLHDRAGLSKNRGSTWIADPNAASNFEQK